MITNPRVVHVRLRVDTTGITHALRRCMRILRRWDRHRTPPLSIDGHAYRHRTRKRRPSR